MVLSKFGSTSKRGKGQIRYTTVKPSTVVTSLYAKIPLATRLMYMMYIPT